MASPKITVTVRLVRSFTHRNIQHLVYHDVDSNMTVEDFRKMVDEDIPKRSGLPPPFKKFAFDTLKISHKAFGAKTTDPVINTDKDEQLMLGPDRTLSQCDVENETELSYFRLSDYKEYQKNPTLVF